MQHLFLSKDLSLLAKEKGFNEPCFGYYINDAGLHLGFRFNYPEHNTNSLAIISYGDEDFVFAPMYQQIIDWFREKHSIYIDIWILHKTWSFSLSDLSEKGWTRKDRVTEKYVPRSYPRPLYEDGNEYKKYYEALNKAIEEAFKLI